MNAIEVSGHAGEQHGIRFFVDRSVDLNHSG
jgi:hypothetical protein